MPKSNAPTQSNAIRNALDHWTAAVDGRVVDRTGATVAICHQLPLDPVPAFAKARFIATACNAYHGHVAALRDLLGDRPGIQTHDGRIVCVHCGRDYTGEKLVPAFCDSDDCPASAAYRAVAIDDAVDAQLTMDFPDDAAKGIGTEPIA